MAGSKSLRLKLSLRSGLDFTKHEENSNSQSFTRSRGRLLFCGEAIYKVQYERGKNHTTRHRPNATACIYTCGNDQKSCICQRNMSSIIMQEGVLSGHF